LEDVAYNETLTSMIKERLKSKPMKIEEIEHNLGVENVKATLKSLIEQGLVLQNEHGEFSLIPMNN